MEHRPVREGRKFKCGRAMPRSDSTVAQVPRKEDGALVQAIYLRDIEKL